MSLQSLLSAYDFQLVWTPEVLLLTVVLATVYLLVTGRFRLYLTEASPVPLGKKLLFLSGLVFFYLGLGSPLSLIGHFMFSVHMLQQAMLYLIMPPLLLLGTPNWLIGLVIRLPLLSKLVPVITHPVLTLVLFNGLFSLYHMPSIFDAVMQSFALTTFFRLALLFTAFLMWLPIIAPLPEFERLSDLRKMGYMFLNGVLLTPACALIIFAGVPLYDTYIKGTALFCTPFYAVPLQGPKLLSVISTLDDQQLGGVMMKLVQEVTYGSALAYIFFRWFRREREDDLTDLADPQKE
ncbi:cytochrome c oxidase assembly factor CtaG [Brevibacillus humidisoli]|uniref:cytochrome c oxidase assembly factor CtaG n=1 Tax=Brevibacillus humidisoli TaxID=2895522 RepID=UPI001E44A9E2|nr:cytochrome c oxidase assembly factor CtaG [Brevibacillus humidisoli]UFJ42583.1 cytochrome c oxidase assembly factor CtaG [Brevibacillus humidisoli]